MRHIEKLNYNESSGRVELRGTVYSDEATTELPRFGWYFDQYRNILRNINGLYFISHKSTHTTFNRLIAHPKTLMIGGMVINGVVFVMDKGRLEAIPEEDEMFVAITTANPIDKKSITQGGKYKVTGSKEPLVYMGGGYNLKSHQCIRYNGQAPYEKLFKSSNSNMYWEQYIMNPYTKGNSSHPFVTTYTNKNKWSSSYGSQMVAMHNWSTTILPYEEIETETDELKNYAEHVWFLPNSHWGKFTTEILSEDDFNNKIKFLNDEERDCIKRMLMLHKGNLYAHQVTLKNGITYTVPATDIKEY